MPEIGPIPVPIELTEAQVDELIPHRFPFRFINGATIIDPGRSARAYMSRLTDPKYDWLKSHFLWKQIVPGAVLAEAAAEVLGVAVASGYQDNKGLVGVYTEIEPLKFRRMVLPTDLVLLEAELNGNIRHRGESYFGRGIVRVSVAKNLAAKGELGFGLVSREQFEASLTPVAANKDQAQDIADNKVVIELIPQEQLGLYQKVAEQTGFQVAVAAEEGEYYLTDQVASLKGVNIASLEEVMQSVIIKPAVSYLPVWIGQVAVSIRKPESEIDHAGFNQALEALRQPL